MVREITFDEGESYIDSPVRPHRKKGPRRQQSSDSLDDQDNNNRSKVLNGGSGMSEAEELLKRLKELG